MTNVLGNGGITLSERGRMNLNALALASDLRDRVRGEVRFDAGTRAIYAHDSCPSAWSSPKTPMMR